jgi:hypothetical protein
MDRRFAALLVAGALSGVATELVVGYAPFRLLAVFAGAWVVAGAWIGHRARSSGAAAAEAAGFLAAMVCAFYVTVIVMQSQLRATLWLFWIVVALTGGRLLGLAGWSTRARAAPDVSDPIAGSEVETADLRATSIFTGSGPARAPFRPAQRRFVRPVSPGIG